MAGILIAKTEDGKPIYLTGTQNRDALKELRVSNRFYCPDCGNAVLLKIGAVKIPHFAHRSLAACGSSEPESALHLKGKILLHQFFTERNVPVELEKYLPAIRQRADLFVDSTTAIEFQCSSIAASEVARRSAAYRSHDHQITWIGGSSEEKESSVQIVKLLEYQKEMLIGSPGTRHLLLLNPETRHFYYYSNLFPISGSRWIGKVSVLPEGKQTFPFAVPKQLSQKDFETVCSIYEAAKLSFVRSQSFAKNRYQNAFWRLCYELGLDRRNLPASVGVPIFGSECIAEQTVIWQLKVTQALRIGKAPADLASEGSIKLHPKGTAGQFVSVLNDYTEFLEGTVASADLSRQQFELLYFIYCKSVRKLRK